MSTITQSVHPDEVQAVIQEMQLQGYTCTKKQPVNESTFKLTFVSSDDTGRTMLTD